MISHRGYHLGTPSPVIKQVREETDETQQGKRYQGADGTDDHGQRGDRQNAQRGGEIAEGRPGLARDVFSGLTVCAGSFSFTQQICTFPSLPAREGARKSSLVPVPADSDVLRRIRSGCFQRWGCFGSSASMARMSWLPPARTSPMRCLTTRSKTRCPLGSSETSTCLRSSRPRLRRTKPRLSRRSTNSTAL